MDIITGIILIILVVFFAIFYTSIKSKAQLKNVALYITNLEKNTKSDSSYEKLIEVLKKSSYIKSSMFVNQGYYARILKICRENSSNIKVWQLLKEILSNPFFLLEESQKSKTLQLLLDIMTKEFKNTKIKDKILENIIFCLHANQGKMEFISYWFSKSVIRLENPTPDLYIINIPIKIHNLRFEQNIFKINFDLLYFQINQGNFTMGNTYISYNLFELFQIFLSSIRGKKEEIFINFSTRKLFIYEDNHARVTEIKYLKFFYNEVNNINDELKKMDAEITKLESFIKTIETSDIYNHQINTYQQSLNLLRDIKSKGIEIKEEYFHFLRERTLSFYVEDIEPDMFKVENQKINWEVKYQYFKEDYDFFTNMIEEYNNLKNN